MIFRINLIIEIILLTLQTFKSHKLRSFLTTLGITIGVTTVISILSLIEGFNQTVLGQIRSLGSDFISLTKAPVTISGNLSIEDIAKLPDLTIEDAIALAKLPTVEMVVPSIKRQTNTVKYRNKEVRQTLVIGTTPEFFLTENHIVEIGRALSDEDINRRRAVCAIGNSINNILFDEESGIGKELKIDYHRVKVVGVLKKQGSYLGQDRDNIIVMPYTFYEKIFLTRRQTSLLEQAFYTYTISIKPKAGMLNKALDDVEEIMRRRRGLKSDEPNNFGLATQEMLYDMYKNITRVGFIAIVAIGVISLVVGGIGIMNIMLVSVSERTREIGIRKAVGASNQNILLQFIAESATLSLVGGIVGIILGISLAWIVSSISPLKAAVSYWMIILGFGFSAAVGIFFGIYPARKAALLNPIEALRYE